MEISCWDRPTSVNMMVNFGKKTGSGDESKQGKSMIRLIVNLCVVHHRRNVGGKIFPVSKYLGEWSGSSLRLLPRSTTTEVKIAIIIAGLC